MKVTIIEFNDIIEEVTIEYIKTKYPDFIEKNIFDEQTNLEHAEQQLVEEDKWKYKRETGQSLSRELYMRDELPSGIKESGTGYLFRPDAVEPFLKKHNIPCPVKFKQTGIKKVKQIVVTPVNKIEVEIDKDDYTIVVKKDGIKDEAFKNLSDITGKSTAMKKLLIMIAVNPITEREYNNEFRTRKGLTSVGTAVQRYNKKLRKTLGFSKSAMPIKQVQKGVEKNFFLTLKKSKDVYDAYSGNLSEYDDKFQQNRLHEIDVIDENTEDSC